MTVRIIETECVRTCGRVTTGKTDCCGHETEHLVRVFADDGRSAVMTMYGDEIKRYRDA